MKTVKTTLEKDFKCIADKCPRTCCSGWQIVIDEASLDRYEELSCDYAKSLKANIDFEEGTMLQYENGDCAFLNHGLCEMINALGEDILCDTCRLFPRHVEEYPDLREWSLSLSCPEVINMLFERTIMSSPCSRFSFTEEEDDMPDPYEDDYEDFDYLLFTKLLDSRRVILNIIDSDSFSLTKKISFILAFATKLQVAYDEGLYFEMDEIIEEFEKGMSTSFSNIEQAAFIPSECIQKNFNIMYSLERLSKDWDNILGYVNHYPSVHNSFDNAFLSANDSNPGDNKVSEEALLTEMLKLLIFTYYPGSVYNGMIYAYTKMCIFFITAVDALGMSLSNKKELPISINEFKEIIYDFFRETEHSDENINSLLEYFNEEV